MPHIKKDDGSNHPKRSLSRTSISSSSHSKREGQNEDPKQTLSRISTSSSSNGPDERQGRSIVTHSMRHGTEPLRDGSNNAMSDSERLRDHQLGNIETGERLPDGLEADAKRWQEAKNAGALNYGDLKKVKEEYYLFDVLVLAEIDSRRISIRKLVDIGQQHRQLKITFRDAAKLSAKADEWPSFKAENIPQMSGEEKATKPKKAHVVIADLPHE